MGDQGLLDANCLKDEGNLLFREGRWAEAKEKYSSALDLVTKLDNTTNLCATLHGNMAACFMKEEQWSLAIKSCSAILALPNESSNVKALFRRGVSNSRLHNFDEAKVELQRVLQLEPSNTAAKLELAELFKKRKEFSQLDRQRFQNLFSGGGPQIYEDREKEMEKKRILAQERDEYLQDQFSQHKLKARRERGNDYVEQNFEDWKTTFESEEYTKKEELASASSVQSSTFVANSDGKVDGKVDHQDKEDEDDELLMKGYKQTSDGRKTSFFSREIDSSTQALLGDILPKLLDSTKTSSDASVSASAIGPATWNTAGTWEDRDMSLWAVDRIKSLCSQASYSTTSLDPIPLTITSRIKEVVCEGSAQVIFARGKKKIVYDFLVKLEFIVELKSLMKEGTISSETDDTTVSKNYFGTLEFCEVTGDGQRSQHIVSFGEKPSPEFWESVSNTTAVLADCVAKSLDVFDAEFKTL